MTIRFMITVIMTTVVFVGTVALAVDREADRGARATNTSRSTTTASVIKADPAELATAKPVQSVQPATSIPMAPQAGEQINWHVISGGGGGAVSANYLLSGTIGQTAVGLSSSPNSQCLAGFWQNFSSGGSGSCCVGRVGDPNGLGGDEPTIGDVAVMIDAKFITGSCDGIIACLSEADINQSGGLTPTCDHISIGDISMLIDYLFITGPSLGLSNCL